MSESPKIRSSKISSSFSTVGLGLAKKFGKVLMGVGMEYLLKLGLKVGLAKFGVIL
jgi:hypothetical protein